MKIYKSKTEALLAAEKCLQNAPIGAFIDYGSYRGGMYDCIFILNPISGNPIFEGAY